MKRSMIAALALASAIGMTGCIGGGDSNSPDGEGSGGSIAAFGVCPFNIMNIATLLGYTAGTVRICNTPFKKQDCTLKPRASSGSMVTVYGTVGRSNG